MNRKNSPNGWPTCVHVAGVLPQGHFTHIIVDEAAQVIRNRRDKSRGCIEMQRRPAPEVERAADEGGDTCISRGASRRLITASLWPRS